MKPIQMVDLKSQYLRIRTEVNAAIQGVIDSTSFIKGGEVALFEEELAAYLEVKHVISCGNGTDALQIALMALDLKPGDEVITTNFTFIATLEVIALMGLTPVIVDAEPDTFNISPDRIREALTPKTRAIIPVHLFGQCANMDEILRIARKNNLFVIEDAAQATGAEYQFPNGKVMKAGTMGTIGTTSFFPSKNLGCYGDGGAIFTNDDHLAKKLRSIANHGMEVKYHHDTIGVNSRLDTIQAAILRIKLPYLEAYHQARLNTANFYDEAFEGMVGIIPPARSAVSSHIFHQYTLRVRASIRNKLQAFLLEREIPSMVYYPIPLHRQKAFLHLGYHEDAFPVSNELCSTVLSLPMHTELDEGQLDYITRTFIEFYEHD